MFDGTAPTFSLDRTSLIFAAVSDAFASAVRRRGQTIRLTQIGLGTATWTALSSTPWLVVAPTSGSGPAILTIATHFAPGLTASQTGRITLMFTGAANTDRSIELRLGAVAVSPQRPTAAYNDDVQDPGVGVQVSIDSGPLQPVVYGDARTDIAAAFARLPGSTRAGGHYIFDWSTLSNGVHSISWRVTAECGRSAGIGGRLCTVNSGTNVVA